MRTAAVPAKPRPRRPPAPATEWWWRPHTCARVSHVPKSRAPPPAPEPPPRARRCSCGGSQLSAAPLGQSWQRRAFHLAGVESSTSQSQPPRRNSAATRGLQRYNPAHIGRKHGCARAASCSRLQRDGGRSHELEPLLLAAPARGCLHCARGDVRPSQDLGGVPAYGRLDADGSSKAAGQAVAAEQAPRHRLDAHSRPHSPAQGEHSRGAARSSLHTRGRRVQHTEPHASPDAAPRRLH
eukprot:scaffold6767_cov223-Isochrysis_galbana.AAC.5